MNFSKSFIKILQFGYLSLVIIGLVGECVFYNQMGIRILRYSSVMDILISPIATLIDSPPTLFILLFLIVILMIFVWFLHRKREKKWSQSIAGLKTIEGMDEDRLDTHYNSLFLTYLLLIMISYFLGLAIAYGGIVSNRIRKGEAQYTTKINFNSGESEMVYLLHTNSGYNFYFSKGNKNVKIAPIGTIKNIEITDNPKLK